MDKSNKVITINNRTIKLNAATIIIAAILLYVAISLFIYMRKEPVSTYKVNKSTINNNITLDALAIRQEEVVNSTASGYICYYVRDGEKTKKNATVCTVDATGQLYDTINDSESYDNLLTDEDYKSIRSVITLYKVNYDNTSFYDVYNFKTNIDNKVLELTNEILMQQAGGSQGSTLAAVNAPSSGVITYYIDGYEGFDINSVTQSSFDKSQYTKQTLKSGDVINANTPVVKVIPSESWNIIAPITAEQASALSGLEKVTFKINNSSYNITMPYAFISKEDGMYINISLNKYMTNFLSERFLSVEIILEEDSGLKIPVSAITQKDVYQVPIGYLSAGSNQSEANKLNVQYMNDKGELTIKQLSPTIYKTDETYCYVDPNAFSDTDVLLNIDTNETIAVSLMSKVPIEGIYSANRGIAEFRIINIIKTIDDFAIIDSNGDVNIYDNIITDATKVKENQIIY